MPDNRRRPKNKKRRPGRSSKRITRSVSNGITDSKRSTSKNACEKGSKKPENIATGEPFHGGEGFGFATSGKTSMSEHFYSPI